MGIPPAASTSGRHFYSLAGNSKIMQQLVFGLPEDLRSGRNQNCYIRSILAVPFISLAMAAPLSLEDPLILEMKQGIHAIGAFDVDIAALPSIAPAGSALGNKLFPSECKAAVSPASGNHLYFRAIDKQNLGPENLGRSVVFRLMQHSLP